MVERESLHAQLLDCVPVGLTVWRLEDFADDGSLTLLYANPAASRLAGFDMQSRVGARLSELFTEDATSRGVIYARVCRERRPEDLGIHRFRTRHREGIASFRAFPVLDRAVALLIENREDLTRAERESRRANRFLDSIIEQMPAMIFVKDARDLRFERFNRAGEELLGLSREQLIGKSDYDLFPAEQADFFVAKDREVLAQKAHQEILAEPVETPRGTRWLHTQKIPLLDEEGVPRHLLGISIDVTERKHAEEVLRASHEELTRRVAERTSELQRQIDETERAREALARAEEQLRQSQKMEAIGRLAGGVAHDFNNLLSVVLGYSDLVQARLARKDPAYAKVEEIRKAGTRAAELTRQLLAFSRQQVMQPRLIDLNDVVSGMERMLPRLLGEDIRVRVRRSKQLRKVKADPNQIEQVIMNMVVNARDAMPTGGQLIIETGAVELDSRYVSEHLGSRVGPHAMLAISDTGMSRETIARIFEPFFTTKDKGKGTGLGLSMVLGIVQQSGGSVWVYSELGRGTTFKVYLPFSEEADSEPRRTPTEPAALKGHETVLLVEDDPQVRSLAAEILQTYGYTVLSAESASHAIELFEQHQTTCDLLLTDVVMPDMGGRVLSEKLTTKKSSLRVLYMSGYTDDAVVRHGVLESGVPFVQKPLTPEVLARTVRHVLDG